MSPPSQRCHHPRYPNRNPNHQVRLQTRLEAGSEFIMSYTCQTCQRNDFESHGSLAGHRRFCDGGKWRCNG